MILTKEDIKGDNRNDKYIKIVVVIAVFIFIYFWLIGEVNSSEKLDVKFKCGFMEQFVEIYEMDVVCNKSFKENKINRFEYWTITWKFKEIEATWKENLENGKGRPAMVANSEKPIPQRIFNVDDYMVIPGLDEIIKDRDDRINRNSDNIKIDEDTGN